MNKMIYGVHDKPETSKLIVFAIQQLLAILAATIAVPAIINSNVPGVDMSASAALFGAGVGTIIYHQEKPEMSNFDNLTTHNIQEYPKV